MITEARVCRLINAAGLSLKNIRAFSCVGMIEAQALKINSTGMENKLKHFQKWSLVIGTLFLTACASVGNESLRSESENSVQSKIVEGKTSKNEVRAMFGSPLKTSFTDGGLEIWTFEFSKVSADAVSYIPIVNLFGATASGTKKELVVLFDKKGLVQRFSMSESAVKQKTGVFNN